VLDALPAPNPQRTIGGNVFQKSFHERRLANARLASDEDDLPLSAQGFI